MLNPRIPILLLLLALTTAPAFATPPPVKKPPTAEDISKQRAREAYQRATKYYNIGDFKEALAAFKEAYLAYEDPTFLFNIAQCHRSLGQKVEAVRAYRAYLRSSPQASSRGEVEGLIANLERAISEEQSASRRNPSGTIAPGEAPGTNEPPATPPTETRVEPPPAPATPVASPAPPPATAAVVTTPAPPAEGKPTPVYKKWWLWTIVGVVVVGAGVGVGVGLALSSGTKYPGAETTAGTFRF